MSTHAPARRSPLAALILLAPAIAAAAPPAPPTWADMVRDAHRAFKGAHDWKIDRVARLGDPEITGRRTATEVIPEVYQDADIYYAAKFGQLEKQKITLHYEWNLGGWANVGFRWGPV